MSFHRGAIYNGGVNVLHNVEITASRGFTPLSTSGLTPPASLTAPPGRSFGYVFAGFLALVTLYIRWRHGTWAHWAWGTGAVLGLLAFAVPNWLNGPARFWLRFGELLHRIVNPLILGVIFYGVFTPIAIGMRLFGRDALKLKLAPAAKSYWVPREPPGPPAGSLNRQF